MKTAALCALIFASGCAVSGPPLPGKVQSVQPRAETLATGTPATNLPAKFTWQYHPADPDTDADAFVVFNFYSSTNLQCALTNWPLYSSVNGSNRCATFPTDSAARYFIVATSNLYTHEQSIFATN